MAIGSSTDLGGRPAPADAAVPRPAARPGAAAAPLPQDPRGPGHAGRVRVLAVDRAVVAPVQPVGQTFSTNGDVPQPPSAAHCSAPPSTQQDVFSQLLVGRPEHDPGRVRWPGVVATVLSVRDRRDRRLPAAAWPTTCCPCWPTSSWCMPALPLLIVIFGFLPPSQGSDDLLIGLIIAHHRLGLGRPGAPRPDAVAAQPGLRGVRAHHRRARLADHRLRDPAQPDADRRVARSCSPCSTGSAPTPPSRSSAWSTPSTGAGAAMLFYAQSSRTRSMSGYWWWFIPPGLAVALLGTVAGAAQLRHRRVHQPAAAGGRADRRAGQKTRRRPGCPSGSSWAVTPVVRPTARPAPRQARPWPTQTRGGSATTEQASRCWRSAACCVDYGAGPDAVHAVVDADLVLRRGEVLGLAGESGSGKSTLAYAAIRLLPRARHDHRRRGAATTPEPAPRGGPARRRRGTAPRAALVADRGGAAERDERAEPGPVDRRPAHRRAAGAPAGPSRRPPAAPARPSC